MSRSIEIKKISEIKCLCDVPIMCMMVGLPGSGKSTIAEAIGQSMNKSGGKTTIHSSDELRKELYGDEKIQRNNNTLFSELHRRIKDDLRAGINVIYDATNISKKFRRQFLDEIKNIVCYPIGLCVMTPYETCLKNNLQRVRNVPDNVIRKMLMNWQPPHYSEGFRKVKYIFSDDFEKYQAQYTINYFFNVANEFSQENSHHSLSLGEHCTKTAEYIQEHCPDNLPLLIAAMLHDNGKLYTKTRINAKGVIDGNCHYYQHHSYGAYECLFYLHNSGRFAEQEMTYIANLIYYHMHPYNQWKQSEKALNKDKSLLGDRLFNDIMLLHDADLYAH